MTITLDLSPEQEAKLKARAEAVGILDPIEYLRTWIDDGQSTVSGAVAIARFEAATKDMPVGYGDPALDSPELAQQLRSRFSNRNQP